MTRTRLLAHLRTSAAPSSVKELAGALELHPNSLRVPLHRLVTEGLVRRVSAPPGGRGRPGYRFTALPERDAAGPYWELARALTDELATGRDAGSRAIGAGERWGRAAVEADTPTGPPASAGERLIELLDANGFAPRTAEPSAPVRTIDLHRCPFGRLAAERPQVICGVHLGLMRGALEALGERADNVTLEPFVEPNLCLVHLAPTTLQRS